MPEKELNEEEKGLLRQNIIDINDRITFDTVWYVRACIKDMVSRGSPDATVVLTCPGGDAEPAMHIYDLIRSYPGFVTGKVFVGAQSMAPVVLQACDQRECAEHATLFVHSIGRRISVHDLTSQEKVDQHYDSMLKSQEKMLKVLKSRIRGRKKKTKISEAVESDTTFTSKQALKVGLIDAIV